MNLKCEMLSERLGLAMVLEQTPAESTAYRFAKLDLKSWPEAASVVKGDPAPAKSLHQQPPYPLFGRMDPATRSSGRALPSHDLGGAITHLWMGEHKPDPDALASFIRKIFLHSENAQVAFSPEFTICNGCGRVSRGLRTECGWCGSGDVDGITRITGYFTRTSSWNGGKRAELRDRVRSSLQPSGLRE